MITYEQFVEELNDYRILEAEFEVLGYSHYKKCRITRMYDTLRNGKTISLIRVHLSSDPKDFVSFLDEFDDTYKLFRLGKKGAFTLKQLWHNIKIIKIVRV